MIFLGISTTVGSANFIVTLLRTRAPGMSINRRSDPGWGTLTASVGNIFAVPAVSLAFFLLWMDRHVGTHFFDVHAGGQPLLWQHLFWMFGHPWVYAIVLPAMGMVSDGLPVFCRRPWSATRPSRSPPSLRWCWASACGCTTCSRPACRSCRFPSSAPLIIIAVPSAVAVFAWIATIWTGRPVFTTAFLFFTSFIFLFVIGGVSGFMTASVPVDWQLTDTYFVVAHLHYVLIGINVFPVVGGIYFWFPKFTGRLMNEGLGTWNFWIMFIGFNLGFFPMHILGLLGMPRRIYTYADNMGWDWAEPHLTIGAFVFAVGIAAVPGECVLMSLARPRPPDPIPGMRPHLNGPPRRRRRLITSPSFPSWQAVIPSGKTAWTKGRIALRLGTGLVLDKGRETIGTTVLDAEPDVILKMPGDSYLPFSSQSP